MSGVGPLFLMGVIEPRKPEPALDGMAIGGSRPAPGIMEWPIGGALIGRPPS
jgi:hypothetical protein